MEGNPALHLALTSVGFTRYRERSIECVKLLLRWADEKAAASVAEEVSEEE